jgi:hypothetical protein
MSKFLEILEQHDPANQSKMDAAFQAKFFLYEQEVPFSAKGSQIILHAEQGDIILEAVGMKVKKVADAEEENQEKEVDIDSMADNAAQSYDQKSFIKKRLPTASNKGGKMVSAAVKDRAQILPQLANAVKERTKTVKQQLQNYRSQVQ